MVIGYKQTFPDGTPTLFKEKILLCEWQYNKGKMPPSNTVDMVHILQPKLHTMREDAGGRWDMFEGNIQHVYGNRTKQRRQFLDNRFYSWQKVNIIWTKVIGLDKSGNDTSIGNNMMVLVNGRALTHEEVKVLARNDGFPTYKSFLEWFNKDFSGKIIHWTSLRY